MNNRTNVTFSEIFDDWNRAVAVERFRIGAAEIGSSELDKVPVEPGQILVLGGEAGVGKSALVGQAMVDALRIHRNLRAAIISVEMSPIQILDRALSRISGVPMTRVRKRQFDDDDLARLQTGKDELRGIADRLLFIRKSPRIDHIADAVGDFGARLLVIDYLQRLQPPTVQPDARMEINAVMRGVCEIAATGVAVIGVSALSRQRDGNDQPTLASLRESTALGYDPSEVYIMARDDKSPEHVTLWHRKSRHNEERNVHLKFDAPIMRFTDYV